MHNQIGSFDPADPLAVFSDAVDMPPGGWDDIV
jgi:hypothetical protein